MKSRSFHNSTKKSFMIFLPWRYGLSWSTTHPLCFPSRNITKNAETHLPPMHDVIIETAPFFRVTSKASNWPLEINTFSTVKTFKFSGVVWSVIFIKTNWEGVKESFQTFMTKPFCENNGIINYFFQKIFVLDFSEAITRGVL